MTTDTLHVHPTIQLNPYVAKHVQTQNDDWSGVTSAATRRKIQNRINARAYRQRKHAAKIEKLASAPLTSSNVSLSCLSNAPSSSISSSSPCTGSYIPCIQHRSLVDPAEAITSEANPSSIEDRGISSLFQNLQASRAYTRLAEAFEAALVRRSRWLIHHTKYPSPTIELLLNLTCWNVFRAFMHNVSLLSFDPSRLVDDSAISPFSTSPHPADLFLHLPPALQPTDLQRRIQHHPAYDVFPDASLREQIILAEEGSYDADALCADLIGWPTGEPQPHNGLIVWGEPWRVESWEASEDFVRRHLPLVKKCKELIDSSNRWRLLRGETRIVIEEPE